MMTNGLWNLDHTDANKSLEGMFQSAWRNSQIKKLAKDRGKEIGENTPFAYCCFEYRQLEVGNGKPENRIPMSLSQAIEHNIQQSRRRSGLKTLLDAHSTYRCLYKIENRSGLYRTVPFERFAKWNEPQHIVAIHLMERSLAVFEPLWEKLSNAILDALEEAVDA